MTTSQEMAVYEPPVIEGEIAVRDVVDGWAGILEQYAELAASVCDTDFVPKEMRGNVGAVTACWLTGRELGIGPMMSLKHVILIDGTPSLTAEYKRARVLAAGHEFQVLEHTVTKCTIRARRRGGQWTQPLTYTIEMARTAGLVKPRGAWTTRPRKMNFARVTSEMCDMLFPDVTMGLATTELVEDGYYSAGGAEGGDMPSAAEAVADDGTRTVARRPRKAKAPKAAAEPPAEDPDDAGDPETALAAKASLTRIGTLFGQVKLAEDRQMACAASILGRPLKSLSGLSQAEADKVISVLAFANKSPKPLAALSRKVKSIVAQREDPDGTAEEEDEDEE